MKNFVSLLLLAIFSLPAFSQSISIFDIDTTNFPTMKAKFYAFDKDGNIQRPSANELTLKENGVVRTITSVNCPIPTQLKQLSSVLVVDVSGSMKENRGTGVTNLDLAKTAANSWIKGLPAGNSECAITSFDGYNYFIQDYTTSKTKLLDAIDKLNPQGSTNYEAALLQPNTGGLEVTKRARYKKVIIFLSDGLPNFEPNTAKIISEAKLQGCTIFCVTLGLPAPQCMKDMATQTGGNYFENVTTIAEAERVYNSILQLSLGGEPCNLEWESELYCNYIVKNDEKVNIELKLNQLTSYNDYFIPVNSFSLIDVQPSFVSFGKLIPNSFKDTTIKITAINSDFVINNIVRKNGASAFSIVNTSFPITIKKNTSISINVRLTQVDSSFNYSYFEIESSPCTSFFSANGGFIGGKNNVNNLNLIKPNGGEVFVVGNDSIITWEGISPRDKVKLDYSIDNGKNWIGINKLTENLKFNWLNIPKPKSNLCLARVTQINDNSSSLLYNLLGHSDKINCVNWSPDGSKVATASEDYSVIIWNAKTGDSIHTITDFNGPVNYVCWSPDGTKLLTNCYDRNTIIWDGKTYGKLLLLNNNTVPFTKSFWSNKGDKIFVKDGSGKGIIYNSSTGKPIVETSFMGLMNFANCWNPNDTKIADNRTVYDAITGKVLIELKGHIEIVRDVCWSPDGKYIATASDDYNVIITDVLTGKIAHTLSGHTGYVYNARWNSDGTKLASVSFDKSCIIWDTKTGIIINKLLGHNSIVKNARWSPDDTKLVTTGVDGVAIVWNTTNWLPIVKLTDHKTLILDVNWSPDGKYIATAGDDQTTKIWTIGEDYPLQSDISDSVFSIVAPTPLGRDVDMKECLVAAVKDSVVSDFMQNVGSYRFRTDSIYFSGSDASAFQLVSGIPRYELEPGKTKFAELRFMPKRVGKHTAKINIIVCGDTLIYNITGVGVQPMLQVVNNIIDFGKIKVGASKDSIQANTIKNTGTVPITITKTLHAGPNDVDFTTLSGAAPFTLQPGETAKMNLRFNAKSRGRTSGQLKFEYNGVGSPAVVQLFAEGLPADTNCEGRSFVFRNFNLTSQVVKNGNSFITPDSTVRLTESKSNEVGGISYSEKVSLLSSFVMKFSFRFSNGVNSFLDGSLPGADGIAVLFQNGRGFRTTENGGSLGYNGIINCVALEMDMYRNSDYNDPNGNHVALQIPYKDTITSEHNAQRTFKMNENIFILRPDSTVYYGVVKFDANKKHLEFYLDSNKSANNLVMSVDDFDFSRHLKLEYGDFAYIGITGSTGASVQTHEILSWEFCSDRDEVLSVENGFYESEELVQNENTISLSQGQIKSIKIIDFFGKTVIEEEVNTTKIDINKYNLSSGMYYIIARDEFYRSYYKKVSLVR